MAKRDAYPLQWPEAWTRTPNWKREKPKFRAQFVLNRDTILRWLGKRGSNAVITSDLPLRGDGLPYANASCPDPGVAVYWVEKGVERVIACDRWSHVTHNLRAVELTIEAMRGIARWGAAEMVERTFQGFAALPAAGETGGTGPVVHAPPPWEDLFDVRALIPNMAAREVLAIVKLRHRDLIKKAHPDHGGSTEKCAELNVAFAAAEKSLG